MRLFLLLSFVSIFVFLTGCGGDNRPVIGYSAMSLTNPFFKVISDNLSSEAARHGYRVVTNDANEKVELQAQHIDDFIVQKVTAIVLNPVDRNATGPAIQKANEAGIPVFTCDLQCAAEGVEIAGHVGTDNEQGGRLAGAAMAALLREHGGGDVVILHFKQANSCVLRVKGFTNEIDDWNAEHPNEKVNIVKVLEGGANEKPSYTVTLDALGAHPNIKGIFAINDPSALGAYTALEEKKRTEDITIIGFDGQLIGKRAIKDGKIYADPIQFPVKMAEMTVDNIIKHLSGEEFEKVRLIKTELYTKEDADKDPELK